MWDGSIILAFKTEMPNLETRSQGLLPPGFCTSAHPIFYLTMTSALLGCCSTALYRQLKEVPVTGHWYLVTDILQLWFVYDIIKS